MSEHQNAENRILYVILVGDSEADTAIVAMTNRLTELGETLRMQIQSSTRNDQAVGLLSLIRCSCQSHQVSLDALIAGRRHFIISPPCHTGNEVS